MVYSVIIECLVDDFIIIIIILVFTLQYYKILILKIVDLIWFLRHKTTINSQHRSGAKPLNTSRTFLG
jgi:hypothetical protein